MARLLKQNLNSTKINKPMIKVFYLMIPFLMINACKTQTPTITNSNQSKTEQLKQNSSCPNEGDCTVIVHQNSKLTVSDDGTGALYPQIQKGDNLVVEYTFMIDGPEGTADGNYSETVHFEIPSNMKSLKKQSAALAEVNLLFGKHCFCPGEAGYYPITDGKLTVENKGETLTFDLSFQQDKTSQKLSHITQTVKLK